MSNPLNSNKRNRWINKSILVNSSIKPSAKKVKNIPEGKTISHILREEPCRIRDLVSLDSQKNHRTADSMKPIT